MWTSLLVGFIGIVTVYFLIRMRRRYLGNSKISPKTDLSSISQIASSNSNSSQEKNTSRISRAKKFLETVQDWAQLVKTFLQYIIGVTIVALLLVQVLTLALNNELHLAYLEQEASNLLKIVAVGLIISTVIELAYMLFTNGPDEAIDPIITAVAAVLLIRLPSPTLSSHKNISSTRIFEILTYGVIVAVLIGVRELYLNGVHKRKE
jgi:hypothetical protein